MVEYDVIVIGAGASGLTSAMYASRSGLKTCVIERGIYGGQIQNTGDIENYSGFPRVSGAELSEHMYKQALEQGVEYMYGDVLSVEPTSRYHVVHLDGESIKTKAVIIATGVKHRVLGLEKEKELTGRGVSYCAICDGAFFKGGQVAVVGGGDSALEEAVYLSGIADKVTLIHRRSAFRGQKVLQDKVFNNKKIEIRFNSEVSGVVGDDKVLGLFILDKNKESDHVYFLPIDGMFVYIGLDPISEPFKSLGIVNENGNIETDNNMETLVKGVFAVGDVRDKNIRQIATAVGDGAIAGTSVREYIDNLED